MCLLFSSLVIVRIMTRLINNNEHGTYLLHLIGIIIEELDGATQQSFLGLGPTNHHTLL